MVTPRNAPYKKAQRKAKRATRNRGKVLWTSVYIIETSPGVFIKQKARGTYKRAEHVKLS